MGIRIVGVLLFNGHRRKLIEDTAFAVITGVGAEVEGQVVTRGA
jgi:hypothetical protein